jgi:phosphatidylinositol alpha-1,6-mannosyltransferase
VLWITGNYYPQTGGLEVYVDRIISHLAELCCVGLVTENHHLAPAHPRIAHFRVANLTRPGTPGQREQAATELRAAIERFRPHVVHFSNAGPAVYHMTVPRHCRKVATVHGNDLTSPWQQTPSKDAGRRIVEGLSACDTVFAVSRHTAGLVDRWGVTAPVTVVTSGCDLDRFRPLNATVARMRARYGAPNGTLLVLTVGRLVSRKGHWNILESLRLLPFPVRWWIVGDGPLRERLSHAIAERGMQEAVALLGRVPAEELPRLYNACDVFVLTPEERQTRDGRLDSEGFGLVFHEASACGKPVIGSDISGCREAVIDGATGLLVPPGDPRALARAMERLAPGTALAQRLAAGGMTYVRAAGGWARPARQIHDIYERLIGETQTRVEPPAMLTPL